MYAGVYHITYNIILYQFLKYLSISLSGLWASEGQISFLLGSEVPGLNADPGTNEGRND